MRTLLRPGELALVAHILRQWPQTNAIPDDCSTPARRLLNAAHLAASTSDRVGPADLAVLLRHVVRAADELGDPAVLDIPDSRPWPDSETLEAHGIFSTPSDEGWRKVVARPWVPDWLDTDEDPSRALVRGSWSRRRPLSTIPADPFFEKLTGFQTYRSPGQREAIRTLLTAPKQQAVIAALPTGSGKSLVAYLDALAPGRSGCSIVIVPTTSLALDQERAFLELVNSLGRRAEHPSTLAYYGELDTGAREAMRNRIRSGEQRIVFTSPESAVQSLSPALFDAARIGQLRLFAVDEAHIVSEWGSDFRPAFQSLGALREALLTAQGVERPFRTLLLSGTLTNEGIATLGRLFGSPEHPPILVPAIDLRAEPGYWIRSTSTAAERERQVLEAIRVLPRPLILYTTEVKHASAWHQALHAAGYRRCELVVGDTPAQQRRNVISRLRNGEADLVVATSAFGLGVDQPDVRCVVHACLPETLNRWYQEVGRGGRDGNPSLALLITTPKVDDRIAKGLASTRLISLERGRDRWEAMSNRAEILDGNRLRLPLFASPTDLRGDNDENRRWNLRLLLLMDRVGLIKLETAAPPRLGEDATDQEWEAAFEQHAQHTVIQLLHGGLGHDEPWDDRFRPKRDAALNADRQAHARMRDALLPGTRVCTLFASTYTIGEDSVASRVTPSPTCATCPGCRRAEDPPTFFSQHRPRPLRGIEATLDEGLLRRFAGTRVLVMPYVATDWPHDIERALARLVALGVRSVYGPQECRAWKELARRSDLDTPVFIDDLDWQRRNAPDLPTAILHRPARSPTKHELRDDGPLRIVVADATVRHPDHASESIGRYAAARLELQRFLTDW